MSEILSRKLQINRKKVREISPDSLRHVAGGYIKDAGSDNTNNPKAPTAQTGTAGSCSGNCCG